MAIGLLAMLVLVSRNSRSKDNAITWDSQQQFDMSERMMQIEDNNQEIFKETPDLPKQNLDYTQISQPSNDLMETQPSVVVEDNLFEQLIAEPSTPPNQLLGMIDSSGMEVLEYPIGSGNNWQRKDSTQPWSKN